MGVQLAASRWRIVPVVLGSTVAFIALAIFVYWFYFTNLIDVYHRFSNYENRPPEGLVKLQVLFYLAFVAHLLGSIAIAAALTFWARAPKYPTYTAVAMTFAFLMVPLVLFLTGANACTVYVSFPIPGIVCDD